ncbi:MAG: hypothetical protein K2K89_00070, partial [Ruminococcus sp.]|nr:hypothetical protein [Ruminococcus sp.]
MKKYLSIICIFLTLSAFASCGDSNSNSDSSKVTESSISETVTETTTEETTEATTEKETEATTQKQVYDLDSDIDFNIVSLSVPSFCDIKHDEDDNRVYLTLYWKEDKNHDIRFYFYRDPKRYEKDKFNKNNITDIFTINGNEYMVDPDSYI